MPALPRSARRHSTGPRRGRLRRRLLGIEHLEARRVMAGAYINEVHFAPLFGNAVEDQYVELRGNPGTSLPAGTYLVGVGSADGVYELGDIHTIFNLSNQSFGANGMLVLLESAAGYAVDPAARVLKGTDGFIGLPGNIFSADSSSKQIRTGSNTFLLIQSNVAPSLTNDIDADDDGAPDGVYANWTILDGVAVFPWVENVWKQRSYAPITFQERGVGQVMPGTTSVTTDQLAYVGRIGQSIGYVPGDWIAGNTVEFDDGTGKPSWKFQLQHGVFGRPRPYAFGGRFLDNVGSYNWVGSVAGSVFLDLNSDGIQQAGEQPLSGVNVVADLDGDNQLGVYTERIEPNNFPASSDISNISSNVTLVSAGSDNVHQGFKVRPVQRFGAAVGEFIFSHEGVGFFNENRRLRMDFYRPAKSIGIDVIGNSDTTPTYGRLEIFDATGTSKGFVRTGPLAAGQKQRLSISSPGSDIAWAVAYSEDSYLSSSPFGMLDNLDFTLPEQSTVTDAGGRYTLQPMTRGNYAIRTQPPATYDQVYPLGGVGYTVVMNPIDNVSAVNFGLLGNLPPNLGDQSIHVSEALAAGGVITDLPIAKGYPSQSLTATITSGDPTGLFSIDAASGRLTLTGSGLDFETLTAYTLNVKLQDRSNATLSDTATIQLIVDDANEPPVIAAESRSISENTAAQTLVATMKASDPDAGVAGQFTWSIVSGNTSGAFAVDPNSGAVRIVDASKIDFEKIPVFNLVLRATDGGATPQFSDGDLTVALTDVNEPPVLVPTALAIKENSKAATAVGTLAAIDPDANQSLQWQITGGSGAGLFQLAPGGVLSVASGAGLDFESAAQYEIVVEVTDTGSPQLRDRGTVTITVQDDNDAPTLFPSEVDLAENSAAGSIVSAVVGSDQDAAQKLTYSISGADASHFVIDADSGQIKVAPVSNLDFETRPTLTLTVTATDNGSTPKSASTDVTIHLTNVNEAPRLVSTALSVAENSAAGVPAGKLQFADPDSGDVVTFEVLDQSLNWLTVNSTTGDLTIAAGAQIDFEGTNQSVMRVRVTDAAGQNNVGTVTVTATNVNDPPTLAGTLNGAKAKADTPFVYTLPAGTFIDQDVGDTLRLVATRDSGFPLPSWLSFDAKTGVLSGTPTADDGGTLQVRITAVDSSNAATSTMLAVDVDANLFPWSNTKIALDVSDDGAVSARDALLVINFLNTIGATKIQPGSAPTSGWLDTNRDNSVSAIDALLIINEINLQSGRGEAEAPAAGPVEEVIWAWDYHQSNSGGSNATDIERRRREEVVELLVRARYPDEL